jgi:hypothetical protein
MFSKRESKQLREQFWISFGKSFPRKWILYNTRIKGVSLKFHFDLQRAMVSMDIEDISEEKRMEFWDKLYSLKAIIMGEYLSDVLFDSSYILDNNKVIARMYVQKADVSIHNKDTWGETMIFLKEKMLLLEDFFNEYKDYLSV